MDYTSNDIRFLKKVAALGRFENRYEDLAETTDDDREAFRRMKFAGLVVGFEAKDGVSARITATGLEYLGSRRWHARTISRLSRAADVVLDRALVSGSLLAIGLASGWLLGIWAG